MFRNELSIKKVICGSQMAVRRASCAMVFGLSLSACGELSDPALSQALKPAVSIAIEPRDFVTGETIAIRWSATNATGCKASGEWRGPRPTSGLETVVTRLSGRLRYTLTCSGPNGSMENTATVIARRGVSPPQ